MRKKRLLIVTLLAMLLAAVMGLTACVDDNNTTTYTVTFETNGGKAVEAMTVDEGKSITLPTTVRDGYTFEGWFENEDLTGTNLPSLYTPSGNVTLYAKWKESGGDVPKPAEKYTIQFVMNGGNSIDAVTVEQGNSITLPTPTKDGFIFVGWFENKDLTGAYLTSPYTPNENLTLYAKWQEQTQPVKQYTVAFETNGGTTVHAMTTDEGKSITLPTTTNGVYEFKGWYDNAGLTGNALTSPYTPTGDITLYAKWEEIVIPELTYALNNDSQSYTVTGFKNEESVTEITIPKKYNTKPITAIGDGAFQNCNGLTSIIIPDSVMTIGKDSFRECNGILSIKIPNSVTSIGEGAFYFCQNLKSIIIGNSVMTIGEAAFDSCSSLENITVDNENKVYNSKNNCLIETISKTLILGCKTSTIPSDGKVTTIGDFAFQRCFGLTNISIPDAITRIGKGAFYFCIGLSSVTIGESVTTLDEGVFFGCGKLLNILIPSSVINIRDKAFYGCSELTNIEYTGTKAEWKTISKGLSWNDSTGDYMVTCTDGKLDKSGNEINE